MFNMNVSTKPRLTVADLYLKPPQFSANSNIISAGAFGLSKTNFLQQETSPNHVSIGSNTNISNSNSQNIKRMYNVTHSKNASHAIMTSNKQ